MEKKLEFIESTGNVGKDGARYKELESGKKVTEFSLAVKDQEGNISWYKVAAWGEMAEKAKDLKQGDFIKVGGKVKVEEWEKDGEKKSQEVITIDEMTKIEKSVDQELTGNVGKDGASYKELESGKKVAEFSLAVNHQDGRVFWLKVKAWDEMAEQVKDLKQGAFIKVFGKVKVEEWQKDGEKKSQEVITISKMKTLEKSEEKKAEKQTDQDMKIKKRPRKKSMGMEM